MLAVLGRETFTVYGLNSSTISLKIKKEAANKTVGTNTLIFFIKVS